jgi:tetratricopeptide (TPR) repeat protein
MSSKPRTLWIGYFLILLSIIIVARTIFRDGLMDLGFGMLFVIAMCLALGILIALPASRAISQGFLDRLFAVNKGKVPKDYSKAKWLVTQERFREAVEEFRKALEEEPENISIRTEIAEILSRDLKDFGQAVSELEACLQLPVSEAQGASILNRIADIQEESFADAAAAIRTLHRISERWPASKAAERAAQRIRALRQTSGCA